jgi:hypothetical protein
MIQRRGHLRLALKSPASRSIRERIGEELDRHGTIQFGVERAKHNAHAAVTECRLQPVRADRCPHGHRQRIALDVIGGRVCMRLGHVYLSSAVGSRADGRPDTRGLSSTPFGDACKNVRRIRIGVWITANSRCGRPLGQEDVARPAVSAEDERR